MTQLLELVAGGDRAVVDAGRGGRLASLVAGGRERLAGLEQAAGDDPDGRERTGWGCYLMAPWPGRLAEASFRWRGQRFSVPATLGRHAIHGVALDAEWTVEDHRRDRAVLGCDLASGGWPLGGSVRQTVELAAGRLALTAEVLAGSHGMPAAVGWHPWFLRPGRGDVAVRVDADEVLVTDDELIASGDRASAVAALDLRDGPLLGDRELDHCYVEVTEPVGITWPDLHLEIATDVANPCYVVYTPRHAACVEPQSAWPNAFGLAEGGARLLGPAESWSVRCDLAWGAPGPGEAAR